MMIEVILDNDFADGPSKSERKREMQQRQELGEKLTRLNPKQLATIPLDDQLREAIADYLRFSQREARRRQLQFIGRLMRDADCVAIQQAWELTQAGSEASKKVQHKLEQWRDRLLLEGDEAINALLQESPGLDRQHLRQLLREAAKEKKENKAPTAARKIFQYLKTSGQYPP